MALELTLLNLEGGCEHKTQLRDGGLARAALDRPNKCGDDFSHAGALVEAVKLSARARPDLKMAQPFELVQDGSFVSAKVSPPSLLRPIRREACTHN